MRAVLTYAPLLVEMEAIEVARGLANMRAALPRECDVLALAMQQPKLLRLPASAIQDASVRVLGGAGSFGQSTSVMASLSRFSDSLLAEAQRLVAQQHLSSLVGCSGAE